MAAGASDLGEWRIQNSGTTASLKRVEYGDGVFVAIGSIKNSDGIQISSVIFSSPDGLTWKKSLDFAGALSDVHHANGKWVAVGGASFYRYDQPDVFLVSSDGNEWAGQYHTNALGGGLSSVAFGQDLWVAVGYSGQIWTSVDASNWLLRRSPSKDTRLAALSYGAGEWLAIANQERAAISINGTDWVTIDKTHSYLSGITDIVFADGYFLGVTAAEFPSGYSEPGVAYVIRTMDGVGWTVKPVVSNSLLGVEYGNGVVVAVGLNGTIISSSDGMTWKVENSGTTNSLSGITWADGRFVAVGINGTITLSGFEPQSKPTELRLGPLVLLASGKFQGCVEGEPGKSYIVEGATVLNQWRAISVITASADGKAYFEEASATNFSRRFYRAVAVSRLP